MHTPPRSIAIVPAHGKHEAQQLAPEMSSWLGQRGICVFNESELRKGAAAEMLIVLGGDGLLMYVANRFPGTPILGVNFGTVGFMAMVERAQWQIVLTHVLDGEFQIQEGPTLATAIRRGDRAIRAGVAINDVVIRAGFRMIDLELYVDRKYVNTYPGDGMIVASPQGSTAYCMAAGGPILTSGVHGFAVTPIAPHSPIRTTFVVPEESTIEMVVSNNREAHLIIDGQVASEIQSEDVIEVTRGDVPFQMIVTEGMSFYDAFRSKFNYLIRPNARPSLGSDRN